MARKKPGPKPKRKIPSPRKKRLLEVIKLAFGKEKMSIGAAMRELGYSKAYSKNPQYLTSQKDFQMLLNEVLPDNELLDIHQELLHEQKLDHFEIPCTSAKKPGVKKIVEDLGYRVLNISIAFIAGKGKCWVIYYAHRDTTTVLSAVDMAYRIKNKNQSTLNTSVLAIMSDEQLELLRQTKLKEKDATKS